MDTAEFITSIAEITTLTDPENFAHPLLTVAKFILADDKGNSNNQGIEVEDFDDVIKSAVDTPIKMRYIGSKGVGGHFGSIPIGHIKRVEKETASDGRNLLVAWAVLYKDEFPDEVQFLVDAFASGEAPGISYEIKYKDSVVKNGVQWLKQLITKAATIVKSPAYGNRTALLALASNREISDEDFTREVLNIITPDEIKEVQHMDDDKIRQLEADAATKQTEIETLKQELTTLQGQLQAVTDENTGLKRAQVLESRVRAYTEAGFSLEADAEKAAKKKDFLANMSDEVFSEYLSDLKALKETARADTATAERKGTAIPKLATMERETTLDDLKSKLRAAARGESAE